MANGPTARLRGFEIKSRPVEIRRGITPAFADALRSVGTRERLVRSLEKAAREEAAEEAARK